MGENGGQRFWFRGFCEKRGYRVLTKIRMLTKKRTYFAVDRPQPMMTTAAAAGSRNENRPSLPAAAVEMSGMLPPQ